MKRTVIKQINKQSKEKIQIKGWIYRIRRLKKFSFIILKDYSGMVQCFLDHEIFNQELNLESCIAIEGLIQNNKNDIADFEISITKLEVLNNTTNQLALTINQDDIHASLDTILNHRPLSLRHPKNQAIFKIQNTIVDTFRNYFKSIDFQEVFTPKLVSEGAEGGTEMFGLDYFEQKAYLTQSPQFYKQMMVSSGFERVFEIGHVYRAEKHQTSRHLNEYVSMDIEVGFIDNDETLMQMEEAFIKQLIDNLKYYHQNDFNYFTTDIPFIESTIPRLSFNDALIILKELYNKDNDFYDLEPESEKLLCQYAKDKYHSDFIFITEFPRAKRPMYTKPLGEDKTHSFDLLFNGVEITTGGLRIHEADKLIENMLYFGVNPDNFPMYIQCFKEGMPPHGGFGLGLERILMMLLGLNNIREASLFPRDQTRLLP